MKRLIGLVLEVKNASGDIYCTDYWQGMEKEPISKIALTKMQSAKKYGWKINKIHKYWVD